MLQLVGCVYCVLLFGCVNYAQLTRCVGVLGYATHLMRSFLSTYVACSLSGVYAVRHFLSTYVVRILLNGHRCFGTLLVGYTCVYCIQLIGCAGVC